MAPGRLQAHQRETLPYPHYGTLNFFDQTASHVLSSIKIYNYRDTAILPQQTGPVIDVLYSAAGNSADEAYYNHGIVGYDFEIGATALQRHGRPAHRLPARSAASAVGGTGNSTPTSSTRATTRAWSSPTATTALLAVRAGLRRTTPPRRSSARDVTADGKTHLHGQVHDQRGGLDLLHDRRLDADHGLDRVEAEPAARAADPLDLAPGKTLKWIAVDFKGNTSGGQVAGARPDRHARHRRRHRPGHAGLTLGAPAPFGAFTPGVAKEYTASTTATVISTAGDATLSVADPSTDHTGHLVNGTLRPAAAAAGPRHHQDRGRHRPPTSRSRHVQAVDHGQRAAAHGHVQQDADVHPEHDDAVANPLRGAGPDRRPEDGSVAGEPASVTLVFRSRCGSTSVRCARREVDLSGPGDKVAVGSGEFFDFQRVFMFRPWKGVLSVALVLAALPASAMAQSPDVTAPTITVVTPPRTRSTRRASRSSPRTPAPTPRSALRRPGRQRRGDQHGHGRQLRVHGRATDSSATARPSTRHYTVVDPTGDVGGDDAADAEPHARHADRVRAVHPGRRQGLHDHVGRHAHVHGRGRDALGRRRERDATGGWSTARSRWRRRCRSAPPAPKGVSAGQAPVGGSAAPTKLLTYDGPLAAEPRR